MTIKNLGAVGIKPKFYNRKGIIATCSCKIRHENNILDTIKVKYEISPNKRLSEDFKLYNPESIFSSPPSWGKFSRILELPKLFNEMEEEDYVINISEFMRDKVYIPFVYLIEIKNIEKYNNLKLKETRRNKLIKLDS